MKKKNQAYLIAGALAFVLLMQMGYLASFGLNPIAAAAGTAAQGAESTLTVSCYDVENGITNGKVQSRVEVSVDGGVIYSAVDADGSVTLEKEQGLIPGKTATVMCQNNTDDGYYEAHESKTLVAGPNSIGVPVRKVGDVSLTLTSSTVALGANDYKSAEYDLATDTIREVFHKPIVALSDCNSTDQVFATGEITDVVFSGGTKVNCDSDAGITGKNYCGQLDKEWLSSQDIVDDAKLWFQSGSTNAAGCISIQIFDGVPFGNAGVANINRANAYDSDNYYAGNITIT